MALWASGISDLKYSRAQSLGIITKIIATLRSGYCFINQTAISLRITHRAHIHNGVLGGHRAVNINLRNIAFVASDVLLQ